MHNKLAPVGEHTLADYDAYVEAVHEQYNGPDARADWFGWDHFMDQHVGLRYAPSGAPCARAEAGARDSLRLSAVPVAERRQAGAEASAGLAVNATHFYTGPKGSLAWELNLACSSDAAAPSVCTCDADNNDKLYLAQTGASCASAASNGNPATVGPTARR